MFNLELSKYIFSYINEENDAKIFEKAINKSIKYGLIQTTNQTDRLMFSWKNKKPRDFIVIKRKISLDQELVSHLIKLIDNQFELSKIIPTKTGLEKGDYNKRPEWSVESMVNSLVCKWSYNEENISVLDMAADIMYRIAAINHPFTNGNKRTALLSVGAFLDVIGLYLYSYKLKGKTQYLEKWETFMLDVAESKNKNKTEEETLESIKKKLFESILMNFKNITWSKELMQEKFVEVRDEEVQF